MYDAISRNHDPRTFNYFLMVGTRFDFLEVGLLPILSGSTDFPKIIESHFVAKVEGIAAAVPDKLEDLGTRYLKARLQNIITHTIKSK